MAETTGIAWCDSTFNPWIGCTRVSPGCDHCYAAVSRPAVSLHIEWGTGKPRHRTGRQNWHQPRRWNKAREIAMGEYALGKAPEPKRHLVFCASLADVFDNEVPAEWRNDLWALMRSTPYLTWLVLTKRIGNAKLMLPWRLGPNPVPWPNVWIGASVVNQDEADRDIPKLLATPAAKRFVSYEPALGPVGFWYWLKRPHQIDNRVHPSLDWIIVGGESGPKARPFDVAWARSTVAQCKAAGVPVFVKQFGSFCIDRNDAEFDGCNSSAWPEGTDDKTKDHPFGYESPYQGAPVRVRLHDRAGADPAEWPEDLRVQEFPA